MKKAEPTTSPTDPLSGWIAPDNLLGLVENTAPFLFETPPAGLSSSAPHPIDCGADALGFLHILWRCREGFPQSGSEVEALADYLALCVACHHTTVATFVPTDVDTKIRGLIWRRVRDGEWLRRMLRFSLDSHRWSLKGISRRTTELAGVGPVSGHDGEWLSLAIAALGSLLKAGDDQGAAEAAEAIDDELMREAREFRFAVRERGCELDALRLCSTLTHNAGDVDQGLSFWPQGGERYRPYRERFGRLAHENATPYGGAFHVAAHVYKHVMAAEGHRNYPLRGVKALRRSPDLLLPLGPFFDDWGALVARHPSLSDDDRAETLEALLAGCRKIAGQRGYYRAIHGMSEALGGHLNAVVRKLPSAGQASWKDSEIRKQIAVPRASFESSMKKALALHLRT